jgi:hypothetical protein
MALFEHSGQFQIGSASHKALDRLETAIVGQGASVSSRADREVTFRVPWHVHRGPLFHTGRGRLWVSGDGRQLHFSVSYRKSASVVAVAVAVFSFVGSELLSEAVPVEWRIAFALVGWLWVWGCWRLLMPRRFQTFLRSELDKGLGRPAANKPLPPPSGAGTTR